MERAQNSSDAQECTVEFLSAAEEIAQAKLAAQAAGGGTAEDRVVAKEVAKRARRQRADAVMEAEKKELECVQGGGGAECTVVRVKTKRKARA